MADETHAGGVPPVGDPVALRAGYEQLRERVLAGRPDGWRLGHAALVRGGMAGWIAAAAAVVPGPARQPAPSAPARPQAGCAAGVPAGQVVAVLCEMALAHAA